MTNLSNVLLCSRHALTDGGTENTRLYFLDPSTSARLDSDAVSKGDTRTERKRAQRHDDKSVGYRASGTSGGSPRHSGTLQSLVTRYAVKAAGCTAAAIAGILLSPDFAFASGIQTLDQAGTTGITVLKFLGYSAAVLGAGGAGMAYAAGMGRGLVGTAGGVGAGGAVAVGADYAGVRFFGGAPAADPSVLLPFDISSLSHALSVLFT